MKVSSPHLRPSAPPARRQETPARTAPSGKGHAPGGATAVAAEKDAWVHDPAAPTVAGEAVPAALPVPAIPAPQATADAPREPAPVTGSLPPAAQAAAAQAQRVAEDVRQQVQSQPPQAAGVHGNLIAASVLNLLT